MRNEADKAELIQSMQAYYIPAGLFIATLISSAGIFLLYSGYALGFLFLGIGISIMVSAFVIFFRFQNKLRVGGQIARIEDGKVLDRTPAEDPPDRKLESVS
jgi:hypothetical protein